MGMNVVRDALSVTNRETSAWDRWREAPSELRTVSPQELETLEKLARNPEQAFGEPVPPWLARSRCGSFEDTHRPGLMDTKPSASR
jgi:hypothetical protein